MARYREQTTKLFRIGSYYYFWYWDGTVRKKKSTGCTTIPAARKAQEAFLRSQPSSGYFRSYFAAWFGPECPWTALRRQNGASLSDDYLENRRGYLLNHLIPAFGDRQLGGIKAHEIQEWFQRSPLSAQTRKHIYNTLNDMFSYAVVAGEIASNPMAHVVAPVVRSRSSRDAFTREEVLRLLRAAEKRSERSKLVLWCLWASGVRTGEIRALRGSDVIAVEGRYALWVRHAMKRRGVQGAPKTEVGFRVAPIPKQLHDALKRYIHANDIGEGKIFPVSKETISRWVREAKEDCGITRPGLVAHSLRHSYVSLLAGRVDQHLLHESAGHSSQMSAKRYDQRWVEERLCALEPLRPVLDALLVAE